MYCFYLRLHIFLNFVGTISKQCQFGVFFCFLICSKMSLCLELRLFSDEVRFSTKFIFGWYHEHKPLNRQECWRTWTFFFPFCRQRSQYVILQCYTGLHLNARDTIQSLIIGHLRALFLISPMEGQKVCCWTSVFHFVHTFFPLLFDYMLLIGVNVILFYFKCGNINVFNSLVLLNQSTLLAVWAYTENISGK